MSAQQSDKKPDWICLVMSRLQAHYKRNSGEQSRLFLLMNQDVLFKLSPLTKLNVSILVSGLERGTLQTFNLNCLRPAVQFKRPVRNRLCFLGLIPGKWYSIVKLNITLLAPNSRQMCHTSVF